MFVAEIALKKALLVSQWSYGHFLKLTDSILFELTRYLTQGIMSGGSIAEWLACWTQAQKGPGSNRSRDAVG